MLLLTRLNGPVFALNPDLIERAEATPDTVITLVNGTRYVVAESLDELSQLVRDYRAETAAAAYRAPVEHRRPSSHPDDPRAERGSSRLGIRAGSPAAGDESGATVVELRPGEI